MALRKYRLLALHGKGTSARIMKTQIKPIVDALGDLVEVEYLEGGERCAPYQGIESIFPGQAYFSWYEQPTRAALQAAHSRVAARLATTNSCYGEQDIGPHPLTAAIDIDDQGSGMDAFTKHAALTGMASSGTLVAAREPRSGSPALQRGLSPLDTNKIALPPLTRSCGSTDSDPSTAGPMTPEEERRCGFDAVICFSQGCAVTTGMLLELRTQLEAQGTMTMLPPVRMAILICGGRPFESGGGMRRVDTRSVAPLEIRSVHVHGRHDTGLGESRQLASLYHEQGKQVIELDIGHCPPRRTAEVNVVAAAIRSALFSLD